MSVACALEEEGKYAVEGELYHARPRTVFYAIYILLPDDLNLMYTLHCVAHGVCAKNWCGGASVLSCIYLLFVGSLGRVV